MDNELRASAEERERFFRDMVDAGVAAERSQPFIAQLCEAMGLSTKGLVSFRLSAGEDGTTIPRVQAGYVMDHVFGEAAQKVVREYELSAVAISSHGVGLVDKSVCLTTRVETTHRPTCLQPGHCSETTSAFPPRAPSPRKD